MSSTIISQPEKEKLYTQVFHLLGMPVRGIELTEEQMDTFNPKDFMDGDKLYFKSEHIIPILKKMTPEQIEIFEHLTGIYRQTLH